MDDTMASNDTRLGSIVPLNSWTGYIKVLNSSSICVFMFGGCGGLGFFAPLCSCVGFSLFLGSIFIIFLQFNKGVHINWVSFLIKIENYKIQENK
jgi:hypothetical protein